MHVRHGHGLGLLELLELLGLLVLLGLLMLLGLLRLLGRLGRLGLLRWQLLLWRLLDKSQANALGLPLPAIHENRVFRRNDRAVDLHNLNLFRRPVLVAKPA